MAYHKPHFSAAVGNFSSHKFLSLPLPGRARMNSLGEFNALQENWPFVDPELSPELFSFTDLNDPESTDWSTFNLSSTEGPGTTSINHKSAAGVTFQFTNSEGLAVYTFSYFPSDGRAFRLQLTDISGYSGDSEGGRPRIIARIREGTTVLVEHRFIIENEADKDINLFVPLPLGDNRTYNLQLCFGIAPNLGSSPSYYHSIKALSIKRASVSEIPSQQVTQAGENIPITHYSKVIAGVRNPYSTGNGTSGPAFNLYDPGTGVTAPLSDQVIGALHDVKLVSITGAWIGGEKARIFRTNDFGQNFTRQTEDINQTASIRGVWAISDTEAWAVGLAGKVLHTTDGTSWLPQDIGQGTTSDHNLFGVFFLPADPNYGWICGKRAIYRTTDGGNTWTKSVMGNYDLHKMSFVNTLTGYVVGTAGIVYRTIDGGVTWTRLAVSISPDELYSQILLSVHAFTIDKVFVTTADGLVIQTLNGSTTATWTVNLDVGAGQPLYDIHFQDANLGFVVGGPQGVIRRTTDGGTIWSPIDHPFTNDPVPVNQNWLAVHFFNATHGMIVGWRSIQTSVTSQAVVMTSTDGGLTWASPGTDFPNEDLFLEMNLIANNRQLYGDWAHNPLYAPSDEEMGVTPDNVLREKIGLALTSGTVTNDVVVRDIAPSFNFASVEAPAWNGQKDCFADPNDFKTLRAGNGYLSVQVHALGDRAFRYKLQGEPPAAKYTPLQGIVRYTNNQQGLFAFAQDANAGAGCIIFSVSITDEVTADTRFGFGPGEAGQVTKRFKVALRRFNCNTKLIENIAFTMVDPNVKNPNNPFNETAPTIYPTAGCAMGDKVYIATQTAQVYSKRFTGDNAAEIRIPTYLLELNLTDNSVQIRYYSEGDQSVYNTYVEDGELKVYGNINDEYGILGPKSMIGISAETQDKLAGTGTHPARAQNRTRKICWLHHNPNFSNKLFGWSFRKDSLLTDPNSGTPRLDVPTHEVFTYEPSTSNNRLTIVDHDVQNGSSPDSVGFMGFMDAPDRTWYWRQTKPTVSPIRYYSLGGSIQPCYYWEEDGKPIGGLFWDGSTFAGLAKQFPNAEGFLGHRASITTMLDVDTEFERNIIFGSLDHYLTYHGLTGETWNELSNSSRVFFKLDYLGFDQREGLADFTELKVWDAISLLAKANHYLFGFNLDNFFLLPQDLTIPSAKFDADAGGIIDIVKVADNDIRNIVNVAPFSPQLQDADWEVTHVGGRSLTGEELAEDARLFAGDLLLSIKTRAEASLLMVCVKQGRLLTAIDATEIAPAVLGDADDQPWDLLKRNPPIFKWLTYLPTMSVTLMKAMAPEDTTLFLNTTYASSDQRIVPGDIVIFTNPDTNEEIGRVITEVDSRTNRVEIEHSAYVFIEAFVSLSVVRANVGSTTIGPPDFHSDVREWARRFSDEGIAVVKGVRKGALSIGSNNKVVSIGFGIDPIPLPGTPPVYTIVFEREHELSVIDNFQITKFDDAGWFYNGLYQVTEVLDPNTIKASKDGDPDYPGFTYDNTLLIDETYLLAGAFGTTGLSNILRLNTLIPFKGVNLRQAGPGYQHYSFIVSSLPSSSLTNINLPEVPIDPDTPRAFPIAYIHGVDELNMEIDIGPGDFGEYFKVGDVLNAYYIMSPTSSVASGETPPFMGLSQDLPTGLASMRWVAEPGADLFNVGDSIRIKLPGMRLVRDSSSIYTRVDVKSIKLWGEQPYDMPDNRFIGHESAEVWAKTLVDLYNHPRLDLDVTIPFDPELGFLNPGSDAFQEIAIISKLLFPSIAGFKVSGRLRSIRYQIRNGQMKFQLRTKEIY